MEEFLDPDKIGYSQIPEMFVLTGNAHLSR